MNVYDFDNTIYEGDSTKDFYAYCVKEKPRVLLSLGKQAIGLGLYLANIISKTKFKEYFFSFLKHLDNPEETVQKFWDSNITKIKKFYLSQQKEDDLVISASPFFLVNECCNRIGISHVIASDVDISNGKFNGENVYGKEKVKRYRDVYNDEKINDFYSDSYSDSPMANYAENAYIVSADEIKAWSENGTKKINLLELIRYSFWGGMTTVFNLLLFYIMVKLGINYVVSNVFSYCIAVVVSYFLNKFFVFEQSNNSNETIKFIKYIFIRVLAISIDTGLLYLLVTGLGLNVYFMKIVVSVLVIILTYIGNKIMVFKI